MYRDSGVEETRGEEKGKKRCKEKGGRKRKERKKGYGKRREGRAGRNRGWVAKLKSHKVSHGSEGAQGEIVDALEVRG